MRILIMVLSYNAPPFDALMKAQLDTWAKDPYDDVEVVFYQGGFPGGMVGDEEMDHMGEITRGAQIIQFKCTDAYYLMAGKFKLALEYVNDVMGDYDIIFRTNSSSYVNKKRLIEFAKTLPTEKLYAGWTFTDSEDFGGACVSGAGIFLSRDCAEILHKEIDPEKEIEEDVYIGRILRKHGIVAIDDKSRFDFDPDANGLIGLQKLLILSGAEPYHVRFKGSHGDRIKDADNMRKFHKMITNE